MSYSVYVQKFVGGEPAFAPYDLVESILRRFGSVDAVADRIEFTPDGEDICEVGFVGGDKDSGIDSIGFERPVSSDRFRQLIFELLEVEGMCYFEQDADYVLARTDISSEVPSELLEALETSAVTVISSPTEVPL